MAPRSHCEHRQNRQRSEPKSRIVKGHPRHYHQHGKCAQGHPQPLHSKSWCTGEDSNLRSPLGAADLQSAAINHSATCAHNAEQNSGPVPPSRYQRAARQASVVSSKTPQPPRSRLMRKFAAGKLLLGSVLSESSATCLACFCCYAAWRAQGLQIRSWRRDLNPRPSDYKSDALPAELRQHVARLGHSTPSRIVLPANRDNS
jgi:hypothetical protein